MDKLKQQYGDDIYKRGIYKISFVNTPHTYIGYTLKIGKFNCNSGFYCRWKNHLDKLIQGIHYNKFMQRVFNECGKDSIVFEIVEFIDDLETCVQRETDLINELKCDLNFLKGKNYPYQHKYTEEQRRIRSERRRGKQHSTETKGKMSKSALGNTNAPSKEISVSKLNSIRECILKGGTVSNQAKLLNMQRSTLNKNLQKLSDYNHLIKISRKNAYKQRIQPKRKICQ